MTPEQVARDFAAGNYMGVAVGAQPDQWQYHAARGIACDPAAGIRRLAQFDHEETRFYSAVLEWMQGDEDAACRGLERIGTAHSQNLLALIRRPRIKVLAQLQPIRHSVFVLRDGIRHDAKFEVVNFGPLPGDAPSPPYATVADFRRQMPSPDLFVSIVVEWHQIPTDLHRFPCPTIGFTNDHDLHIQGISHWFAPFDIRGVIDHVYEWPTVKAVCPGHTVSFPLVFGAPSELPPLEDRHRDIDVLFSGTLVSGYNPEKELLFRRLLELPDLTTVLIDGHVATPRYFELLSRAKITPSFCRHRGGIQTRVIETLAMGSISVVQPDSVMQLWADRSTGLWEYDEALGPGPQILDILKDYETHARGAREHALTIRRQFAPESIASRFFRFCTFLAARPRDARDAQSEARLNQKRVLFAHGPGLEPAMAETLASANSTRFSKEAHAKPSPRVLLDDAREWLLLYARAFFDNRLQDLNPKHLKRAFDGYRKATRQFPDSLVARFNLFRALLHLGNSDDYAEARDVLASMLESDETRWQIEALDDVLPYDFMPGWFNYRAYLDLVVDSLKSGRVPVEAMRRHLLASAHHYRSVLDNSVVDAERAVALDGGFTPFRLTLAEQLLRAGEQGAEKAVEILVELASGSTAVLRAYRQLRAAEEMGAAVPAGVLKHIGWIARRVHATLLQTEHYYLKVVAPYFVRESVRAGGSFGAQVHQRSQASRPTRLSIIVCGFAGWGGLPLLEALSRQTVPRHLFDVIYVDGYGEPESAFSRFADVTVSLNERELLDCQARAWMLAIEEHARGEVFVICQPGWVIPTTFVEETLAVFYGAVPPSAPPGPPSPRRIAVVGPRGDLDSSAPRFVAFRSLDYVRAGGLDQAEVFRGDATSLTYLADRLARTGVLVVEQQHDRAVLARLTPWWHYSRDLATSGRLVAAQVIWSELFDGNQDLMRKIGTPQLIEQRGQANIVRFCGAYFVVPFVLGAIDWTRLALEETPPLRFSHSVAAARAICGGKS